MDLSGSWPYICDVARSRLAHNKTERHVSKFGEGIEVLGVAGEIVARRFLGISELLHEGFDGGIDLRFAGMRIDVKATLLTPSVQHRFLQWPEWKRVKADIIVLTAIDPIVQKGTMIGFATRTEIIAAPINATRSSPCHEIPVMNLSPSWLLLQTFERERMKESGSYGSNGKEIYSFEAMSQTIPYQG